MSAAGSGCGSESKDNPFSAPLEPGTGTGGQTTSVGPTGGTETGGTVASAGVPASGGSTSSSNGGASSVGGTPGSGGGPAGGETSAGGADSGGDGAGGTDLTSGGSDATGGDGGGTAGTSNQGGSTALGGATDQGGEGGEAPTAGGGTGGTTEPQCEPADEICDGLDNDCDGDTDEEAACPNGCTGFEIDGHGYMFCQNAVTAANAVAACVREGMGATWIESEEENQALLEALADIAMAGQGQQQGLQGLQGLPPIPGLQQGGIGQGGDTQRHVFIGGTDAAQEGRWLWAGDAGVPFWQGGANGMPVEDRYSNWAEGQPNSDGNEDCSVLLLDDGEDGGEGAWNDVGCTRTFPFVCESRS